ncbi:MAG: DUF4124 domain-containing protein, partial [Nitrospinaceae bacterium]
MKKSSRLEKTGPAPLPWRNTQRGILPCAAGVALAVLVLAAGGNPAAAGIFKWVDEQGQVHFSDNKSRIPKHHMQSKTWQKIRGTTPVKSHRPAPVSSAASTAGAPALAVEKTAKDLVPDAAASPPEKHAYVQELSQERFQALKAAQSTLQYMIHSYQQLFENVTPNAQEGKFYMMHVQKFRAVKLNALETINQAEWPALNPVSSFLESSAGEDVDLELGGTDYEQRLTNLYERMRNEVQEAQMLMAR